ncbi:hypothetical protein Hanom_Chr16g01416621 [Helianthus anomalus]
MITISSSSMVFFYQSPNIKLRMSSYIVFKIDFLFCKCRYISNVSLYVSYYILATF